MDLDILDDIPFEIDFPQLLRRLHIEESDEDAQTVRQLADEALKIGRPKAVCAVAYVDDRTEDTVLLNGILFRSRVLQVNLEGVYRVVVYAATCGMELEHWSRQIGDMLAEYWADNIKLAALGAAMQAMNHHIGETLLPGPASTMNPGSLADWPLTEQRPLFELLGHPQTTVGIELTESCLMIPNKSVTGLRFPTDMRFENCQLCPRENCPGRRAPYDKELYASRYARTKLV